MNTRARQKIPDRARALGALAGWMALVAPGLARAQGQGAEAGYDRERGAFVRTRDGAYELNPYAMVQLQSVTDAPEASAATTGFVLRAAKFILHGHVFDRALTFHFQLNAAGGQVVPEDVYLQWEAAPWLTLLAGQVEVPFNRQHITLEAYQQLIDRALVDRRFNLGRDLGVALYVHTPDRRGEAVFAVWNGAGQNALNDDPSYLSTARLGWNPWGPVAYREGDVDPSRAPRLALAVAGAFNPRRVAPDPARAGATITTRAVAQLALDATLRYRGLAVSTEVHARRRLLDNEREALDYGVFVQAGLFVVPRRLELVARYAALAGELAPRDTEAEVAGGVNYLFHGHRLKLQADYGWLRARDGSVDQRLRVQLEFFL